MTSAEQPEAFEPIPRRVWHLAAVIVFGAFMSGLDATIVNVGLDTIARDLHASLDDVQWVASAHLIALGVSLPAAGWLGRRVGVGRMWLTALAAFTATSALCAAARSVEVLIVLRVAQGIAAGVLIPAGQTVLGQAAGPGRLGRVMASVGLAVGLAPALGPVVGGLVIDGASWPWLFLINVPIGIVGLVLGLRVIPRGAPEPEIRLDLAGLALVTVGVPALVYGLTAWGEQRTLVAAGVLVPTVGGALLLALFVRHARRHTAPILDLGLFRIPTFAAACATTLTSGAAMFGAFLLLPLYFQSGRGSGVLETGLLSIGLSVGTAVTMPFVGGLVDRLGGGTISVVGCAATALTTFPFVLLDVDADGLVVQALLVARGAALALALMPPTVAAYSAVGERQLPDAASQVNVLQRVGGALGGSLLAVTLAGALDGGTQAAFHRTFACLTAFSLLGLASAVWLRRTERAAGPAASTSLSTS
ncbi:DHA2 family efflux MFS transporter permease subunit [Patulibacter sp. NPDC049589]|uniref:DHA2 family efflux MFS transporter permease subunit n=1 Tax=Patulibacter sp. NPDC049589 TaxID=3154731 RepID=UPI00341EB33E